ncbi:MAG: CBS domain-containing protein [Alcanivoracaceae bacterium]|nr:CBS domain-containing protein [Alcanivoracaceae bacterium]
MKRIPHVSALMTAFPWHLDAETPAVEARRFMQDHNVHHLPVTRGSNEIVGVVHFDHLSNGYDGALGDLLESVRCVDAQERADNVLEMMAREHCSVVVVIHHQRLAGIFTWTDACRRFAETLREPFLPTNGDHVA